MIKLLFEFFGSAGGDSITGSEEADILFGGGAITVPEDDADTLNGAAGDDVIYGNGGKDFLLGAGGLDTIYGGIGGDTIYGGGSETDSGDSADLLYGQDGFDALYGNGGDDTILGGDGVDTIYGGFGNDSVRGGNLSNSLGDGGDFIVAGPGVDSIYGGNGSDTIFGGLRVTDASDDGDVIDGGNGSDIIYGNGGNDSIIGGAGDDTIYGGLGLDTIEGGDGVDTIVAGVTDVVLGGSGIDNFILSADGFESSEANSITNSGGLSEVDILRIGDLQQGESIQVNGVGNRKVEVMTDDNGDTVIVIDGGKFAVLGDVSPSDVSSLTQELSDGTVNIALGDPPGTLVPIDKSIVGTVGNDTLTGTDKADVFLALQGVDNITAGDGDDTITLDDWTTASIPTSVSAANLLVWLDASDASTIEEVDGAVSNWGDKSGNNNDGTQAVLADKPIIQNNSYNGKGSVGFYGGDYLALGNITSPEYTYFVTWARHGIDNSVVFATSGSQYSYLQYGDSWYTAQSDLQNIPMAAGDLAVKSATVGAGTSSRYTDGFVHPTTVPSANIGFDNLGHPAFTLKGDVTEVIIYDTVLSNDDRSSVERYLSNKYGVGLDASAPNSNDVIDGGAGVDTINISSGTFLLNPGTLSGFNAVETFNLSGNDSAHELTLTDDYYDTNGGVENDLVTVNLTDNSNGSRVDGATLTGTHAISVQGSAGVDTVHGGAGNDTISFSDSASGANIIMANDDISGIENLIGSALGDTLQGGIGNQTIVGGDGADRLYGDVDVENFDIAAFKNKSSLWLDASDASTITDTGGLVNQWNDKSGQTNHSVGLGGTEPLYDGTRKINGLDTVYTDGVNDFLENTTASFTEDYTFFVMFRGISEYSQGFIFDLQPSGGNYAAISYRGVGKLVFSNHNGTEFRINGTPDGISRVVTQHIEVTNSPTATLDGYVDGNFVGTDTGTQSGARTGYQIGKMLAFGGVEAEFGEIIVVNETLSDADRQQIETYLAEKWGTSYSGTAADADDLSGGAGADIISGGIGNDTIDGGSDNDTITGGIGDDQLTGGTGDDVFIFKNSSGQDIITDFTNPGAIAGDVIHILSNINGNVITNFAQLSANISQNGADTVIDIDPANPGTHTITLTGITAADLTTDDFVFI